MKRVSTFVLVVALMLGATSQLGAAPVERDRGVRPMISRFIKIVKSLVRPVITFEDDQAKPQPPIP